VSDKKSKWREKQPKLDLEEAKPAFYQLKERVVDFRGSIERYKDLRVLIDDLFEEVKNDDYDNLLVSFVLFVIEVSYS